MALKVNKSPGGLLERFTVCEVRRLITMTMSYFFQFRMFVAEARRFSFNNQ